jgi:hypothetical protein
MRHLNAILAATIASLLPAAVLADNNGLVTRYGTLTMQAENRVNFEGRLFFHGKPLRPDVRGNNALYLRKTFRLANADTLLFEDSGGTGCPYLWYFVTVSRSGATATHAFGSCGELIDSAQSGQTITLRTHGFLGPFEPAAAQRKASGETHIYVFRHGVVTENGKAVPCADNCN